MDGDAGRRLFLHQLAVVTAGSCLGGLTELKAALAESDRQGKPLLWEGTLNTLIEGLREQEESTRHRALTSLSGSLLLFLDQRFTLTQEQQMEIGSLRRRDVDRLRGAVEEGLAPANRLYLRIQRSSLAASRAGAGGIRIDVTRLPREAGGADVEVICSKRAL